MALGWPPPSTLLSPGCATCLYTIKPKAFISSGHQYHLRGVGSCKLYQCRGLGEKKIGQAGSIDIVAVVCHAIKS